MLIENKSFSIRSAPMICVFKSLRKEALSGAETGKREKTISILKKQNNCLIKNADIEMISAF